MVVVVGPIIIVGPNSVPMTVIGPNTTIYTHLSRMLRFPE